MSSKLFVLLVSLLTGPCDNTVADYQPPISCMPVQVTNYIPYRLDANGSPILQDGELVFYTETNFQCMVPCNKTGGLVLITKASIGYFAACIADWYGNHIEVAGQTLWCIDQFGDPTYRKPYFNPAWDQWVIPVDVLTHEPQGYLTYEYSP